MREPRSEAETREHISRSIAEFERGEDFSYNIFPASEAEVFGSIGLHRRGDDHTLELGYWIRASEVGQGYATEAAAALTRAALALPGIERVQIECDPANRASARVPEKLGYVIVDHRIGDKTTPSGDPRDTLVYELSDVNSIPTDL